ncbi:MAG TPA: class I SAM-dependent methyltransferase [Thermoanaerobaculia bacterium]|jgi:2-polyprenyl-6-hydroxyphenyl methylase/3-demethylubiquinone-9 3-methyltransferase|nr:class I SAM-dependent methyltransferase [Thermoanaerobaculia bacterium]
MMGLFSRRAFKPVYIVYYKFLFGRRFPFAERLAARVHAFEAATGRGDAPASKAVWEEQYREGGWEFMRGLDELARYSVIAGYLHHLRAGGSVLDVGSGEGLLADHLRPLGCSRYLGVDLSEAAIRQAAGRADAKTAFAAANAESYTPPGRWDAIVFNECVYYFSDPVGTVRRYERFLEAGGVFIVSTFRSRRADVIVRRLLETCRLLEETAITNRKGTWVVRVLEPAAVSGEIKQ